MGYSQNNYSPELPSKVKASKEILQPMTERPRVLESVEVED